MTITVKSWLYINKFCDCKALDIQNTEKPKEEKEETLVWSTGLKGEKAKKMQWEIANWINLLGNVMCFWGSFHWKL